MNFTEPEFYTGFFASIGLILGGIIAWRLDVKDSKLVADLVLWNPAFFGVRPEVIVKGGMIVNSRMGDDNATIPTPQPVHYKSMFGSLGKAVHETSITFVSKASIENGTIEKLGLEKIVLPVENCRNIGKKDMVHNDVIVEDLVVDPESYEVLVNGEKITCEPAEKLPMTQLYNLF